MGGYFLSPRRAPMSDEDYVPHRLNAQWTMWYDQGCKSTQKWGEHLQRILDFDTVENFWRLYNNMVAPTSLKQGCTYHLFRTDVRPEWEDPVNRNGGKWVIIPQKSKIDDNWLSLLLATIGETLTDAEDEICGIVVSIRKKQDKIAIWTKGTNEGTVLQIGNKLKECMVIENKIDFQSHRDAAMTKKPKSKYVL